MPKCFLSLGDWTARIWNEDLRSPLITGRRGGHRTGPAHRRIAQHCVSACMFVCALPDATHHYIRCL
jgi:hypothetical protein